MVDCYFDCDCSSGIKSIRVPIFAMYLMQDENFCELIKKIFPLVNAPKAAKNVGYDSNLKIILQEVMLYSEVHLLLICSIT